MAKRYFQCDDVSKLLCNKFVVIIGDSVQRGVYKDLVMLLQKNRYLLAEHLKNKGEVTFEKDVLIEGGRMGQMTNGTGYREVRQYQTDHHLIRFYFVTRCYSRYVCSILDDLVKEPYPDVIMMNSCLWDMTRYGPAAIEDYKENLERLFEELPGVVPDTCLVIWNTTLPISKDARGGFLVKEVEFLKGPLRVDILEANFYAAHKAARMNWDVLDLHYYLRYEMSRRAPDGVHWDMVAHRIITNLILSHIADAWGVELPSTRRCRDSSAERNSVSSRENSVTNTEVNQDTSRGTNRSEHFQFGMASAHRNPSHMLSSSENMLYSGQNFNYNAVQAVSLPNRNRSSSGSSAYGAGGRQIDPVWWSY